MWYWFKKLGINLILLVVSIGMTLIIAEILLRSIYPIESFQYELEPPRHYFKADDEVGHDINEKANRSFDLSVEGYTFPIWSNELGCFDTSYDGEENPVLLVGDSMTWAYVAIEHKWGKIIEDLIQKRVLKCGVNGYTTKGELIKAKRVISQINMTPNLIIVGYFTNDLADRWLYPRNTVIDGYLLIQTKLIDPFSGEKKFFTREKLTREITLYQQNVNLVKNIKDWLFKNSVLYHKSKNSYFLWKIAIFFGITQPPELPDTLYLMLDYTAKYPWLKEAWALQLSDIKEFQKYASEIGSKLLFVLIPPKEMVYDFLRIKEWNDITYEYPEILKEFFVENDIEYYDITPDFRQFANQKTRRLLDAQKDLYYRYDGHLNIKGNRLAGLLVTKSLIEKGLIEIEDKNNLLTKIEKELQNFK
jgi:hypothetical protein